MSIILSNKKLIRGLSGGRELLKILNPMWEIVFEKNNSGISFERTLVNSGDYVKFVLPITGIDILGISSPKPNTILAGTQISQAFIAYNCNILDVRTLNGEEWVGLISVHNTTGNIVKITTRYEDNTEVESSNMVSQVAISLNLT